MPKSPLSLKKNLPWILSSPKVFSYATSFFQPKSFKKLSTFTASPLTHFFLMLCNLASFLGPQLKLLSPNLSVISLMPNLMEFFHNPNPSWPFCWALSLPGSSLLNGFSQCYSSRACLVPVWPPSSLSISYPLTVATSQDSILLFLFSTLSILF